MRGQVVWFAILLVFISIVAMKELDSTKINLENQSAVTAKFYIDNELVGICRPGESSCINASVGNHTIKVETRQGQALLLEYSIYLGADGCTWKVTGTPVSRSCK